MSRTAFRRLMVVWMLLIVGRLLAPSAELPADVQRMLVANVTAFFRTGPGMAFFAVNCFAIVVGAVGMFRTRRWGPPLFLAGEVLSLVVTPFTGWYAATGWQVLFEGLAYVLSGALFTLAVYGAARPLFEDRHSVIAA